MTTREALHQYLDGLPDELLEAADRVLKRAFDDPIIRALHAAPYDDEPFTEEDRRIQDAARRAIAAGDTISHDEVRRLLGRNAPAVWTASKPSHPLAREVGRGGGG